MKNQILTQAGIKRKLAYTFVMDSLRDKWRTGGVTQANTHDSQLFRLRPGHTRLQSHIDLNLPYTR